MFVRDYLSGTTWWPLIKTTCEDLSLLQSRLTSVIISGCSACGYFRFGISLAYSVTHTVYLKLIISFASLSESKLFLSCSCIRLHASASCHPSLLQYLYFTQIFMLELSMLQIMACAKISNTQQERVRVCEMKL